MNKKCNKCTIVKPLNEFSKDFTRKDGLSYTCKCCRKIYENEYNNKHKEKIRNRDLKKKYGITYNDKLKMIQSQDNKCYICKKDLSKLKEKQIHVDHNHKTGQIRKILCNSCNNALGMVNEDINILTSLINYIKE